jgi:hypothetical protein
MHALQATGSCIIWYHIQIHIPVITIPDLALISTTPVNSFRAGALSISNKTTVPLIPIPIPYKQSKKNPRKLPPLAALQIIIYPPDLPASDRDQPAIELAA